MNKKLLLGVLLLVSAAAVQAKPYPRAYDVRQVSSVVENIHFHRTVHLDKEDQFGYTPVFAAALKGDVRTLAFLQRIAPDGAYLLKKGKDGNNVFHIARDKQTFQALVRSLRKFYPQDYQARLQTLLSQKNNLKETPLRAQLNYGKTDVFLKYFPQTLQFERLRRIQEKINQGGLVAQLAEYEKTAAVESTKDLSGLTPAAFAKRNLNRPGMAEVEAFFTQHLPFL